MLLANSEYLYLIVKQDSIWLVNAAVEEQEREEFSGEFEDLKRLLTF
jgi:hypothetical protein